MKENVRARTLIAHSSHNRSTIPQHQHGKEENQQQQQRATKKSTPKRTETKEITIFREITKQLVKS